MDPFKWSAKLRVRSWQRSAKKQWRNSAKKRKVFKPLVFISVHELNPKTVTVRFSELGLDCFSLSRIRYQFIHVPIVTNSSKKLNLPFSWIVVWMFICSFGKTGPIQWRGYFASLGLCLENNWSLFMSITIVIVIMHIILQMYAMEIDKNKINHTKL